jgi:hypothetical protein
MSLNQAPRQFFNPARTPRTNRGREQYAKYMAELPSRIAKRNEEMRQMEINRRIQEARNNPLRFRAPVTPRGKRPNRQLPVSINAMNVNTPNSNAKNSNNQSETVCTRNGCFTRIKRFFGYGGRKSRRTRRKTRTR